MKAYEMGGARTSHVEGDKSVQNFGWKAEKTIRESYGQCGG
jgi:hypothetical protein